MNNKYKQNLVKEKSYLVQPVVFFLACSDKDLNNYEIPPTAMKIKRGSGWKKNFDKYIAATIKETEIYTNDETLLQFCSPAKENNRYKIFLLKNGVWVNIHTVYENLRAENNLTKMFYAGYFD